MKRILVVNVNWLGDVLFSTPLIRAVRERFPDAYIACMVVPRCRQVLELNPRLNEIIIYDEDGVHKGLFGKFKLISYLKAKRFDTAILLHRSFTRALIVFLAGVRRRIGYYTKKRSIFLTDNIAPPAEELHRVDYFLNLGKPLGVSAQKRDYEFFVSQKDKTEALELLRGSGIGDNGLLIAVNPGGNWQPKRWPKENFAELADEFGRRFGARIVITGAKKDIAAAQEIASLMKTKPVIFSGETTLKTLAAVFERANLVVSNDSGPMHIAVAMGSKTIALFGPTSPQITGPIGKGRYITLQKKIDCEVPCYDLSCKDYRCMQEIKVEDVLNAAENLLS